MGKNRGPYQEEYPVGTPVRVVKRSDLERFAKEWKFHNPLKNEQLRFAGTASVVEEVSFYHGGDELYKSKGMPGLWHELCLSEANDET